ncbi:MAG: hypothetical protein WD080_10430 [Egibacteraceae bacterium]
MSLHLRTRLPALTQSLADEEPSVVARLIGQVRIAIGVVVLLAPRAATRRFLRAEDAAPDALTAWRMAGVRDVALGLGTVMAARKASPSLRGWVEASALADAGDVYAFSRDGAFYPVLRAAAGLTAGALAGVGIWTARRLGDPDPE